PTFATFADALAPGVVVAQAIGRWGNWFNVELFGRPTKLPWGLEVPLIYRPNGFSEFATFHPTFIYESIWCLVVALLLLRLEKLKMAPGSIFIAYVALYSFGRIAIESIRIDDANLILGLRLNIWVGFCVCVVSSATLFRRWKSSTRG
ncbi:MAG: prolipoprotein diacylglyceryl transferase family protein, partial [Actinomycetes bacterium]